MKKLLFPIFLGLLGSSAFAQNIVEIRGFQSSALPIENAHLFTYDREKVNSIMDAINKENSSQESFIMQNQDTVKSGGVTGAGFFLIGFGSGCIGSIGGIFLNRTGIFDIWIIPIFIGALAGTAAADLIVARKTHSRSKIIWTTVGGVVAPVALVGLGIWTFSKMTIF